MTRSRDSRKRDVLSLEAIVHKPGRRGVSIEEMDEAIRDTAVKRHLRSMKSSRKARTSTPRRRTKRVRKFTARHRCTEKSKIGTESEPI